MSESPAGLNYAGPWRASNRVQYLLDFTYVDESGQRQVEQQIFDEVFRVISAAKRFVLVDLFLYNDFQGHLPETTRALTEEMTQCLLNKKRQHPQMPVIVITDPVNTIYGGLPSPHFEALKEAGVMLHVTDLDQLRDSNPAYSRLWRLLIKRWGNGPGSLLPNPFGAGRVSIRSWLRMLNFKANHRKVIIADSGGTLVGLVTSANPHDGSSAHRNAALRFEGSAVLDLLESEKAVMRMGGVEPPGLDLPAVDCPAGAPYQLRVVTERQIKVSALELMQLAEKGWTLDLAMFYLSDRDLITALKAARLRGVAVRVLLDPNKDAFGWRKNGIPNRPVAQELVQHDIEVRWSDTHGEQCHLKSLQVQSPGGSASLLTGSANYTRRNLDNFNLETNVLIQSDAASDVMLTARRCFDAMWGNEPGRTHSVEYAGYCDRSWLKRLLYRFQEASGLCTF